jgi:uncharacterized protein (UPF0261 family)
VQGLNRISERVLANAAHALAGMVTHPAASVQATKPAIGLTMFGVTTPCVQMVTKQLESDFDCLVFHATGVGGQSMEKLADSGLLEGVIDVSTTEIADEIAGGTLSARTGWTCSRGMHCPGWAPAGRWTWPTSGPGTACPRSSAAGACTATTPRSR